MHPPAPSLALILLVVSIMVKPLPGQSPPERAALLAMADTLAGDSTGGRNAFDAAMLKLQQTLDRHQDWPVAWHVMGRIEQAMWDRKFVVKPTPYHPAGFSHRRGAMDAYARSIRADPAYQPPATELARLLIELGSRKLEQRYREPLLRAAEVPGAHPDVHLALSRLWYSDGNTSNALSAIDRYAAAGGDPGVSAVEHARILQALDRVDEAVAAYHAGLTGVAAAGARAYREDISWAGSPEEIAIADSLPADSIGRWVASFWRERDALEMRQPGERLREHLRRWVYAHKHFRVLRPRDAPSHSEGQRDNDQNSVLEGTDPFLSIVLSGVALNSPGWRLYCRAQLEVDDRGVIYIRHGEPSRKVSSPNGPPNESWLYQRATDRPIFHFLGSHALGTTAATTLVAALPLSPEMLDARGSLDPKYAALGDYIQGRVSMLRAWYYSPEPDNLARAEIKRALGYLASGHSGRSAIVLGALGAAASAGNVPSFSPNLQEKAQSEVTRGRRTVNEGVTSDGFPRTFHRELSAVVQVHGVGVGAGERSRILAVFALDGSTLPSKLRPDGKAGFYYPVAIRLIALDRVGGVVRQLDTIRNYVTADSLRAGQHLTGFLELRVPPGAYQVRVLLTPPGVDAGVAAGRDDLDLREAPGNVRLSDLILGREGSTLRWRFAGQPFPLNPLNAFPRGSDAELFYELDGLTLGQDYRVTMAVHRPGDELGAKPLVESTFAFSAVAAYQVVRRSLGLQQLKPGGYHLTVTIASADGRQTSSRSRVLNILK